MIEIEEMEASETALSCLHRNKRLVIDPKAERYEIQCATCMLTSDSANSGIAAYGHWLRLMRGEYMDAVA